MDEIQVFELDDDFDPLADVGMTPDDEVEEHDYQAPIPDADKSVVPPPVELSPEERMEKLFRGIPGQKFRILRAVALCEQPATIAEVAAQLDQEFPQKGSVYDTGRLMELLAEAGGLACLPQDDGEAQDAQGAEDDEPAGADADGEYLTVAEPEPRRFQATEAGLAMVAANVGVGHVAAMLREEPRYLPIYERILTMIAPDGGAATADLNAAVDPDPLLVEPRRYCGYFLDRLEKVDAARFNGTWRATDLGRAALAETFPTA